MSGTTTLSVAGTQTISSSGSDLLNIGAVSTVDIQGHITTPITVTIAESIGVGLLDTTNIAYADEILTSVVGLSTSSAINLGIDGAGNAVGNGTIEFGSNLGISALSSLNLYGPNDEIILDPGTNAGLLDSLNGFTASDTIQLGGVTATSATFTQNSLLGLGLTPSAGGTVTLYNNGTVADTISLNNGTYASNAFQVESDGLGGTNITVACYRAGTRIATPSGEVAVEALRIGDSVLTVSGAVKPIKWIGRRSYSARFAAGKTHLLPIRFLAGSLGGDLPHRDLWVSPRHAMLIDNILIPSACLVNGASVFQEHSIGRIDYLHIELDSHDVIFAEGAPSETYVNDNNRIMFHNCTEYEELYGEIEFRGNYCAERREHGEIVDVVCQRLARMCGINTASEDSSLRGWLDGFNLNNGKSIFTGWAQDQNFPEAPVHMALRIGKRILASGLANLYRLDLEDAGIGSGRHGFRIELPYCIGLEEIEVVRYEDNATLPHHASLMYVD